MFYIIFFILSSLGIFVRYCFGAKYLILLLSSFSVLTCLFGLGVDMWRLKTKDYNFKDDIKRSLVILLVLVISIIVTVIFVINNGLL